MIVIKRYTDLANDYTHVCILLGVERAIYKSLKAFYLVLPDCSIVKFIKSLINSV